MANVSIVKLKVRRGTDQQRQQITLDQGELGFTTDWSRLFVGDGATMGGVCPAMKFYTYSFQTISASNTFNLPMQPGDIIYETTTSSFYSLLSGANNNSNNYQLLNILTPYNARTLLPTVSSPSLLPGSIWINSTLSGTFLKVV